MAERLAGDPLTLNDAWANAAGRPATGGMHDSVISHNHKDPIVKLINEKNIHNEWHGNWQMSIGRLELQEFSCLGGG